jgi:HD-like signal output (HDOD) protein
MSTADYDRLELLCRRVSTLPVLPTSALQLVKTIDSGEPSAGDLERIIVSDTSLATEFLRLASCSQLGSSTAQYATIKGAIMRMGQRTVRAIATSMLLKDLVRNEAVSGSFDKRAFAKHSLCVGILARFLYARKQKQEQFETRWTADEIFAAGLLSGLSYLLLARIAPDVYNRIYNFAQRVEKPIDVAFQMAYKVPPNGLGAAAAETWNLPEIFATTLKHVHAPWDYWDEYIPLCCLNYANCLASSFGLGIETWAVVPEVEPQVEYEVGLSPEEQETLKNALLVQLEAYGDFGNSQRKAS